MLTHTPTLQVFSSKLVSCSFNCSPLVSCHLQASKWVDDGIYLLASQPVDKCLSQDGAELALQELERYLDSASQNQLTDLDTITREFEAVLNQQFKVGARKSMFLLEETILNMTKTNICTRRASGPGGEGAAEADVHAGHVRQEEGQSEEAGSQTDAAGAAGRSQT